MIDDFDRDDFDGFGCFVIVFFIFVILSVIICFSQVEINIYEYIDLDGNKGLAKECSYEFQGYHSGGQGSPVCVLEDETVIQVKQYKLVESKYCRISDKDCLDKEEVE